MVTNKRIVLFIGVFFLPLLLIAQATDSLSQKFLYAIDSQDYEKAVSYFNDDLKAEVPADKLQKQFEQLVKFNGEMVMRDKVVKTFYVPDDIVYRFVWFGEQGYRLWFKLDDGKIAGLRLMKEAVTNDYTLPEYADMSKFKTKHVLIQSGNYGLPGEISIPENVDDYPVVIIIHGSGPNDRDAGMFGNRPYRDIAYGLASNGIACLRYDKSSWLFPVYLSNNEKFTAWEETGRDVCSVVAYLNDIEKISSERVFLMGHSFGGNQLPRILDSIEVAGGLMVAGNARPLQTLLYEQMEFLYGKDGIDDADKRRLATLQEQIDRLEDLRNVDPAEFEGLLPFGLSPYYWKDIIVYDPVETIMSISEPVMLIQGEGDYQVSMKDYKLFRKALKKRKLDYLAISYPKVNHLLFENEGEPSSKEYERSEHVEATIIHDMVNWILETYKNSNK